MKVLLLVIGFCIITATKSHPTRSKAASCGRLHQASTCSGEIVEETIDFSENGKGGYYKKGDTPIDLPQGIRIVGRRPKNEKPTANDLLIFDTSKPGKQDLDLGVKGEGLAVIIGESTNRTEPNDNRQGGTIFVHFQQPAFQVVSFRFLDIEKKRSAVVSAVDACERRYKTVSVPPAGNAKPTSMVLPHWYQAKAVRITFKDSAALSAMTVSFCRPLLPGKIGSSYRSYNGTENKGGKAGGTLLRKATTSYPDTTGSEILRSPSMPNPRVVSNKCMSQRGSMPNRRGLSDMVWAFGQFLDHDLDLSPSDESAGDVSIPILNGDDPLFPRIPMKRSAFDSAYSGKNGQPRQQINIVTASIDGSVVYGSDKKRANALKSFSGGYIKTSGPGRDHRLRLPPVYQHKSGLPNEGEDRNIPLFLAGDVRANEQLTLTALHTLFIREHNWIARKIGKKYPGASDQQIFQMARKIVAAEIQKITFSEFLPALFGRDRVPKFTGYNRTMDVSIANEFSGAGFRFGHSMLSPNLRLAVGDKHKFISLRDAFFNPSFLIKNPRRVDYILGGLAKQKAQEIDPDIIDDVRNFLFGSPGNGGMDLAALNIQRGRDHGLPLYNEARKAYGLRPHRNFSDVTKNRSRRRCLQQMYGSPDAMDLWVGALSEDHAPGASMGPLLIAILTEQFSRTMNGDKFYYENDPAMASKAMRSIMDVSKVKLSDIIRRNTRAQVRRGSNVFFIQK